MFDSIQLKLGSMPATPMQPKFLSQGVSVISEQHEDSKSFDISPKHHMKHKNLKSVEATVQ
jgi:hypothetical protein